MTPLNKTVSFSKLAVEKRHCIICWQEYYRKTKKTRLRGCWRLRPSHTVTCSKQCSRDLVLQHQRNRWTKIKLRKENLVIDGKFNLLDIQ